MMKGEGGTFVALVVINGDRRMMDFCCFGGDQ